MCLIAQKCPISQVIYNHFHGDFENKFQYLTCCFDLVFICCYSDEPVPKWPYIVIHWITVTCIAIAVTWSFWKCLYMYLFEGHQSFTMVNICLCIYGYHLYLYLCYLCTLTLTFCNNVLWPLQTNAFVLIIMFGASVLMQFPSTIFFHLCNYSNNIKIQFVAMVMINICCCYGTVFISQWLYMWIDDCLVSM